jgi:2-polyprenyl-3-methyl-5-hydroxy-6-metoxy-1,4-benzoquinol methylase
MNSELQSVIDDALGSRIQPLVCEAGCGSLTRIQLPDSAFIVGFDISRLQVKRHNTIDAKVVADIQVLPFVSEWADVVVCWEVLEHVPDPEQALRELARIVSSGGVLILAVPHIWSVKGLVTRLTPHAFHVWFYRKILKYPNAGTEDTAPFPVSDSWAISPGRVRTFASQHELTVAYEHFYEAQKQIRLRQRLRLSGRPWQAIRSLVRVLSVGRLTADATDWVVVFQRSRRSERPLVSNVDGRNDAYHSLPGQ